MIYSTVIGGGLCILVEVLATSFATLIGFIKKT